MIQDSYSNSLTNDKRKEIEKEKYILQFDGIEDYMNVTYNYKKTNFHF